MTNTADSRSRKGDAFALWGEKANQRCALHSARDINAVMNALCTRGEAAPLATIFGSTCGDIVFAVFAGERMHLSAVMSEAPESLLSLKGDASRTKDRPAKFPFLGSAVALKELDYVPQEMGRSSLKDLVWSGALSPEYAWSDAAITALAVDLPRLLRDRGLVVPVREPMSPYSASDLRKPAS